MSMIPGRLVLRLEYTGLKHPPRAADPPDRRLRTRTEEIATRRVGKDVSRRKHRPIPQTFLPGLRCTQTNPVVPAEHGGEPTGCKMNSVLPQADWSGPALVGPLHEARQANPLRRGHLLSRLIEPTEIGCQKPRMAVVNGAKSVGSPGEQSPPRLDLECDLGRDRHRLIQPLVNRKPGKGRDPAWLEQGFQQDRRIGKPPIRVGSLGRQRFDMGDRIPHSRTG